VWLTKPKILSVNSNHVILLPFHGAHLLQPLPFGNSLLEEEFMYDKSCILMHNSVNLDKCDSPVTTTKISTQNIFITTEASLWLFVVNLFSDLWQSLICLHC
jgi:hypothetical protein